MELRGGEFVGEDHAEAVFERGVAKDGGVEEADEDGFALCFLLSFGVGLFRGAVFGGVGEVVGEFVHGRFVFGGWWRVIEWRKSARRGRYCQCSIGGVGGEEVRRR